MPGYVDSTVGILGHLGRQMNRKSQLHIVDFSNLLPLYTSKKKGRYSPILDYANTNEKFRLRNITPETDSVIFSKPELAEGVRSHLFSFFLTDLIGGGLFATAQLNRISKATQSAYDTIANMLTEEHFCSCVVLNGRNSVAAATRIAAQDNSVKIFFWEHSPEHKIYFCDHPPQDYFAYKRELGFFTPSPEQLKDAEKWLNQRTELLSSHNTYSKGWKTGLIHSQEKKIDLCIFTSSQDEVWALGDLVPKRDYEDFYSEISELLSKREQREGSLVMRMHPNTLNKSVLYVLREAKKARKLRNKFSALEIIWPHQNVNSYDLIRSSHHVLVEHSTIGVEAAWLGVPVSHLSVSNYVGLSSQTKFSAKSKNHEANSSMTVEDLKTTALVDVALRRSHYQLAYGRHQNQRWTRLSALKSIASNWTILFLAIRFLNPRINKLILATASRF